MTNTWVAKEFEHVKFNDKRRFNRFIKVVTQKWKNPTASICEACETNADRKGAYRLYDNIKVTENEMLNSHILNTQKRAKKEKVILAIQDTTIVDYSTHKATKGLGTLQTKKNLGLLIHTTLLINTNKVPLGIIDQQNIVRPLEEFGKSKERHERPIEQKESNRWLIALKKSKKVENRLKNTLVVNVADRESDIYDFFREAINKNQEVLIRASHNRKIELLDSSEKKLFDFIETQSCKGEYEVKVPKNSKRKSYNAKLEIRYEKVIISPPKKRSKENLENIELTIILAIEKNPPNNQKPIKWILLTTLEVKSLLSACEKVKWYSYRWQIEVFHKILKSGCKIEKVQLGDIKKIIKFILISSIIAWRIFYLSMLGRNIEGELPCDIIFETYEWNAIYCYSKKSKKLPDEVPSLNELKLMIAKLGGFTARKSDGEPGPQVMWRGLEKMSQIADAWMIFN